MAPKSILLSLVLFTLGIILGTLLHPPANTTTQSPATPSQCPYSYLNPLRCEPARITKKKDYVELQNDLVAYLDQQKTNGTLHTASIYFRDLENGPILNINAQENFSPASLLKLPLLITYYKKAETDPKLLQQKVTIPQDIQSLSQNIQPEKSAQIGKTYTIDELLNLLIMHSDNISWKMLLNYLRAHYSEEDFIATLSDLGIIDPRKSNNIDDQYITVQSYASIFRILYNSSYLNLEMSNKALHLLTQTTFTAGLITGLPPGTQVAHKFGERSDSQEQQLHDCGIIYDSHTPYLLCIMTKGKNIDDLEQIIQELTHQINQEVQKRN
jgi:beta-lactamase class A